MKYHEISESIVLANNDFGANLACIALENELFFIDTSMNTDIAKKFRIEMEKKFDRKASTLILTHGHIDHFFGMGAFKDLKVVAADSAKPRLERFVSAEYTEEVITAISRTFPFFRESVDSADLFMPNTWVKDKMSFGPNNEISFEIVGGHSACSSFIHHKTEKSLFVGDLVQYNAYPYFGEPDTDMQKWIGALKNWENKDIDYYLPGHGLPFNKDYLRSVWQYFVNLVNVLKELKEEAVSEENVPNHPKLPEGYWNEDAIRRPPFDFSMKNLYKKL